MTTNKRKGIWISIEILENNELDNTNKILLSEIISLDTLSKGCFASNEHFANLLGVTKSSASKRITSLTKLEYITTKNVYANKVCTGRIITPTTKLLSLGGSSPENHPSDKKGSSSDNRVVPQGNGVVPQRTQLIHLLVQILVQILIQL